VPVCGRPCRPCEASTVWRRTVRSPVSSSPRMPPMCFPAHPHRHANHAPLRARRHTTALHRRTHRRPISHDPRQHHTPPPTTSEHRRHVRRARATPPRAPHEDTHRDDGRRRHRTHRSNTTMTIGNAHDIARMPSRAKNHPGDVLVARDVPRRTKHFAEPCAPHRRAVRGFMRVPLRAPATRIRPRQDQRVAGTHVASAVCELASLGTSKT